MRIGILTGEGDVPGLNACIKAVVNRVAEEGHEIVGIRRGWGGLAYFNPDDPESTGADLIPLDPGVVRAAVGDRIEHPRHPRTIRGSGLVVERAVPEAVDARDAAHQSRGGTWTGRRGDGQWRIIGGCRSRGARARTH